MEHAIKVNIRDGLGVSKRMVNIEVICQNPPVKGHTSSSIKGSGCYKVIAHVNFE